MKNEKKGRQKEKKTKQQPKTYIYIHLKCIGYLFNHLSCSYGACIALDFLTQSCMCGLPHEIVKRYIKCAKLYTTQSRRSLCSFKEPYSSSSALNQLNNTVSPSSVNVKNTQQQLTL